MPRRKREPRPRWDAGQLRALREHLGLTQQQLADELGTRQQTISEWETGRYQPRGASATLLFMVAERSGFEYRTQQGGPQVPARAEVQEPG